MSVPDDERRKVGACKRVSAFLLFIAVCLGIGNGYRRFFSSLCVFSKGYIYISPPPVTEPFCLYDFAGLRAWYMTLQNPLIYITLYFVKVLTVNVLFCKLLVFEIIRILQFKTGVDYDLRYRLQMEAF